MRRLALLVLMLLVGSGAAWAQRSAPPPDTLVAADYDAFTLVPPRSDAAARRSAATVQFEFDLNGFPPEAEEAFRFAASIWGSHLDSDVPVRVQADFAELEERTLGAAGPACVERSSLGVDLPRDNTWYPVALAEALLGRELNPLGSEVCPGVDIVATFNSALDIDGDGVRDWYFGTDGNTPAGLYDFVTVVLHELGHGLGFVGSFAVVTDEGETECPPPLGDVARGLGCWGIGAEPILPLVFDRFAEDGTGTALLNTAVYPNPSRALGDALQSEAVFFDGPTTSTANGRLPIDLFAPSNFEPGSSFSHLDESVSPAGDPNSLMTPQLARAEAIFSPGPFTCAVMSDIGWPLGADCEALLTGEVASFLARASEDEVALIFQIGAESGFVEAVPERCGEVPRACGNDDFVPAAPPLPIDPDGAGAYEIRLEQLAPGTYTFRLRLRRADGSVAVSRVLRVGVPPGRRLAVFPNPFIDEAQIAVDARDLADERGSVRVLVYDVLGRRVAELSSGAAGESSVLEFVLDGRHLSPGVYIVRVEGASFEATRLVTRVRP